MENFFDAHFVFIWVKGFRKVHYNSCSNLQGFEQPITHMCWDCGKFVKASYARFTNPNAKLGSPLLASGFFHPHFVWAKNRPPPCTFIRPLHKSVLSGSRVTISLTNVLFGNCHVLTIQNFLSRVSSTNQILFLCLLINSAILSY